MRELLLPRGSCQGEVKTSSFGSSSSMFSPEVMFLTKLTNSGKFSHIKQI